MVTQEARYKTASELATASIRRWIVEGTLSPSERLNQDEIAATLGLSRLPVREALRRLESEGLVTIVPRRGAIVATMSVDDVDDIYSVKIAIEGTATRLAVPNLDEQILSRMEELLSLMDEAMTSTDWGRWLDLDKEFHFALFRACRRPRLLGLVTNYWDLAERYRRFNLALPEHPQRSADAHRELLAACKNADAGRAEQVHVEALASSRDKLMAHLTRLSSLRKGLIAHPNNGR